MSRLLERFLRYVRIDTQADERSATSPSTAKQLDLCRLLVEECRAIGLDDAAIGTGGVVLATVPATPGCPAPAIAYVAHVDTSPETSGTDVRPLVHAAYSGGDITLPGPPERVLRVADNPDLARLVGGTVITTDGTTLLGADDKAGVAVIMEAAARLVAGGGPPHGPIRLVFTCDEEIGRGTQHLDVARIGAVCGYTLDGSGRGTIDVETFSADQAIVTVTGVNTHPSVGTGVMVNAIRILAEFLAALPTDRLSPETTSGRDGFVHPYVIEGGVARAEARILLRDFESAGLVAQAALLEGIAARLRARHPRATIDVVVREQYRNMREGLAREPRAVAKAVAAMRTAGLEPRLDVIRGGTDGSLLTALGLPTPNLATGEHNPHSPLEWTSLEEMETAVAVLIALAAAWGAERG